MNLVLQTLLGLAVLGGLFYAAWRIDRWRSREGRAKRRLQQWPLVPLSQLPAGLPVRTVGRVGSAVRALTAPFTGRRCVCYEAIVEARNWHEYRTSNWYEIACEVRATGFGIRQGPAEAEIVVAEGEPVDLVLQRDRRLHSNVLRSPTPEMEAFLARHQERARGFLLPRTLRYVEAIVEEGETVVVAGQANRREDRPASAIEGEVAGPAGGWTLTAPTDSPLMISDDPDVVGSQAKELSGRTPGSRAG